MRVLLVTSRHPLPPWRGNQVRTMEWLQALSGHELVLVSPEGEGTSGGELSCRAVHYPLSPVKRGLGLLRVAAAGQPFQEGLYESRAARRTVAGAVRSFSPDVVVVQMVRCAWAVDAARSVSSGQPIVFDAIDAMGLHFERAAASASPWLAPLLRAEAGRCRRREEWLSETARITVAVAARDLEALGGTATGRVIPVAGQDTGASAESRTGRVILLSGNLGYRPTVDGALWFAREVWPVVSVRVPGARWVLAGARPPAAIRKLAALDGVEVHGDVPDLGAFVRSARVTIAPMASGSGVPMKVLEAMASGVPSVVHPWAADGLVEGAASAVAVAESADAWADAITRLLDDENAARDLGTKGREVWREFYHPDVVGQQIREVVTEAAEA